MTAAESHGDRAIAILRSTRDGEDLDPIDLALLQLVVNAGPDQMTEAAEAAFSDLERRVREGYRKPWLAGIEHLTRDHEGYVYWKGQEVEHWSGSLGPGGDAAKQRVEAEKLARRCLALEARGEPVNTVTVVWRWREPSAPEAS